MTAYRVPFTAAVAALALALTLGADTVAVLSQPAGQDIFRENGRLSIPAVTRGKVLDLIPEGALPRDSSTPSASAWRAAYFLS